MQGGTFRLRYACGLGTPLCTGPARAPFDPLAERVFLVERRHGQGHGNGVAPGEQLVWRMVRVFVLPLESPVNGAVTRWNLA